jgi:hypothetical protein
MPFHETRLEREGRKSLNFSIDALYDFDNDDSDYIDMNEDVDETVQQDMDREEWEAGGFEAILTASNSELAGVVNSISNDPSTSISVASWWAHWSRNWCLAKATLRAKLRIIQSAPLKDPDFSTYLFSRVDEDTREVCDSTCGSTIRLLTS